jgi:hypothetical protein
MIGPGKYDELCLQIKESTQARGVLLVVLDGNQGSGAPCKMDAAVVSILPNFLRQVADEMERDTFKILGGGNG